MDRNAKRRITYHIAMAGYSAAQIREGIAYAKECEATDAREGYILAMSRILLTRREVDEGARFAVEEGYGPRP